MKIQSLSVCVPASCINKCKFCVADMNRNKHSYPNLMMLKKNFYDLYYDDYVKRLEFARDNGCNTIMLTGDGEPILNMKFLEMFGTMNKNLSSPFKWVELQTSGTTLDETKLRFLRNHIGVSTISLSLSALEDEENAEYNCTPENFVVKIKPLCDLIRKYDFNLRLSLNLTDKFESYRPEEIFNAVSYYGAHQVTFRKLYSSPSKETIQDLWLEKHRLKEDKYNNIVDYVKKYGRALEVLPFGSIKYSVHGISTVVDGDCMNDEVKDTLKYLILRPNCKLYSKWDDVGSLIF